jgi:hypothetical protein
MPVMSDGTTTSLRGYRAHQALARLRALPLPLRTTERARPVLEAIMAYAWETGQDARPPEPARISARLQEFLPFHHPGFERGELMSWLYHNLVPEVWDSPALLQGLVSDCICRG